MNQELRFLSQGKKLSTLALAIYNFPQQMTIFDDKQINQIDKICMSIDQADSVTKAEWVNVDEAQYSYKQVHKNGKFDLKKQNEILTSQSEYRGDKHVHE